MKNTKSQYSSQNILKNEFSDFLKTLEFSISRRVLEPRGSKVEILERSDPRGSIWD